MSTPTDYATVTRNAEGAFTNALDNWKKSVSWLTDQFQSIPTSAPFPKVDATEAVERQFTFIREVVDLNHRYARSLAEAVDTLTGVTGQQFQSLSSALLNQVQNTADAAQSGADTLEQTVREQADHAEQAGREAREAAEEAERQQARDAAKAQRQQRKEVQDKARARYENLSKTELSDEAAKRDLPKSGTVDELIERLVAADTK